MTAILTLTMNPSLDIATSIPHVTDTIKLRCTPEETHPGGGGINVSRIIHNLGGESVAMFPCGGYTGDRLRQLLEQEGLTTQIFPIDSHTRQSFSIHETTSGKDFRFLLPGHTISPATTSACLNYIRCLKNKPRYLVASGSLPPGVAEDFYAEVSALAKQLQCHFVLDTSGRALTQAVQAGGIYFFKPSLEELEELTGKTLQSEASQLDAARKLIHTGQTKMLVLSLGQKGALLVSEQLTLRASGVAVTPVSSVGAGDSLVGAMVWALERGYSLEQSLRYGISSATATIMNTHGQMGGAVDIAALLDQIQITRI